MSRIKVGVREPVEEIAWFGVIELADPPELSWRNWRSWLDYLSIWWLKRRDLLQEAAYKKVSHHFETVEFDEQEIIKEIRHHLDVLCDRYGEYPSVVYIGRDIHAQVLRLRVHPTVTIPSLRPDTRRHPITLFLGVEVIFVPWMDGIFAWNPSYASR